MVSYLKHTNFLRYLNLSILHFLHVDSLNAAGDNRTSSGEDSSDDDDDVMPGTQRDTTEAEHLSIHDVSVREEIV